MNGSIMCVTQSDSHVWSDYIPQDRTKHAVLGKLALTVALSNTISRTVIICQSLIFYTSSFTQSESLSPHNNTEQFCHSP